MDMNKIPLIPDSQNQVELDPDSMQEDSIEIAEDRLREFLKLIG